MNFYEFQKSNIQREHSKWHSRNNEENNGLAHSILLSSEKLEREKRTFRMWKHGVRCVNWIFENLFRYGVRVREKTENDSIDQRDLQFYARFLVTKAKSLWIYGSCPRYSNVEVSLEDSLHITLPQTWNRWDDEYGPISYRVGFHFSGPESRFRPYLAGPNACAKIHFARINRQKSQHILN